jgi:septation ring formation regulator EzrA
LAVISPGVEAIEESVEDVEDVADEILEGVKWQREQFPSLIAKVDLLQNSLSQLQSQQPTQEHLAEIQNLRVEIRNLKEGLNRLQDSLQSPHSISGLELVTVEPSEGVAHQESKTEPKQKRRRI